ncbi:Frizzled-4 [Araneus ventricosus]|uniref:Frizzled-4 n=1 Tax=Araneus ventricosus TaxID=182803 RepID=A0A4Y2H713_ARAVE|nr:Frizzled-4 [Araneus ventricosus]
MVTYSDRVVLFTKMSRCKMVYGLLVFCLSSIGFVAAMDRTCEPIRIDTCYDIGYNITGMPNLVGHELQQDAQLQLQTFTPLIQYGCSSRLRFFLCSVYVPMCTEKVPVPIGPCRTLCEDVRDKCQPVLQEFGFPWPPGLNCSKFPPQNNDKHMCMEGPADQKGPDSNMRIRNRNSRPSILRNHQEMRTYIERKAPYNKIMNQHYGLCKKFRHSDHYYYINRTERCAVECKANIIFSQENKYFADLWLAVWSVLCFLCTLFNILIVLVGEYRFRYPEGVIVFISCCFNACAIAYLIRIFAGRYPTSCHMDPQHNVAILIQEGLDNVTCTIIFVILYFFKTATDGWWVILCITWYLTNNQKWRHERMLRFSSHFHLFAWGIPCILTIIILVTSIIDADELIGSCYVGNQSRENLLKFVIVPSFLYIATGLIFLFLSHLPVRPTKEVYNQVQTNPIPPRVPENLDSVTSATGIFMYLYVLPACCVLGADIYQFMNREAWFAADTKYGPVVEIFSLKLFMLQIMGIASCLVIFSTDATKRAYRRIKLTRQKKPVPSYLRVNPQLMNASTRSKRSVSSKANSETIV